MDDSDKQNVQQGGVQAISPAGTNKATLTLEEAKTVPMDSGRAVAVSGVPHGEEVDGRVQNASPSSPQNDSENRNVAGDVSGLVLRPEETEKAEVQSN